jgi:hypothetical protein
MRVSQDPREGSYLELQGRSRQQLGFVNNLLITLALAVLAFAANVSTDPSRIGTLGWRRYIFGSVLVLLAFSLLAGLGLSMNRLQVFRIDARIARLCELAGNLAPGESYQLERICYISQSLEGWSRVSKLTHRRERSAIEVPARELAAMTALDRAAALNPDAISPIEPAVKQLIILLRKWSDKGDEFTWILFRIQTLCFLVAAALIFVSTVTYFF